MRRLTLVGLVAGVVLVVAAVLVWWLPGPRAAVPRADGSNVPSRAPSASGSRAGLPDPGRTPGSINPNVSQATIGLTICNSGWTTTVRPPAAYTNALKLVQIEQYGYTDRKLSDYEEDHLVPLELGGAPRDPANLWPEPRTMVLADGTTAGSDAKDGLENYLHRQVCAESMPLADAQRLIAGDWVAAWIEAGRP